jgi:predicted amidohydrolase
MVDATRLLIKNGMLIDGSGGEPVPNKLLVVEGNWITLVGETVGSVRPETPDDRVIDATGKFILPGLIDAHCHISLHQGALPGVRYTSSAEFCSLWAAHAIGRVLRAGVTGIAVPGGKWFTDVTVCEAVEVLVCKAEGKFLLTVRQPVVMLARERSMSLCRLCVRPAATDGHRPAG